MTSKIEYLTHFYEISATNEKGDQVAYRGKTTAWNPKQRWSGHKTEYKKWLKCRIGCTTSREVLKYPDAKFKVIHSGNYTKEDAERHEHFFIRLNPACVNKLVYPPRPEDLDYMD